MPSLYAILEPLTIELLRIAWNDAAETTGMIVGEFDVENEFVQLILKDLASRVKGIDDTTRETIQMIIGRQASEGWSLQQVRDELLARAVTESKTRADLIAATETATAHESGSHAYYAATGQVSGTEWLLGPSPCDDCRPLGGKVVPLGDEFAPGIKHPPAHPWCTCGTAPILS
jgi:hypothetical protein